MDFEQTLAAPAVPGDATLIALERQRQANARTRWALAAALLLGAAVSAFFWLANTRSSLPPAVELSAAPAALDSAAPAVAPSPAAAPEQPAAAAAPAVPDPAPEVAAPTVPPVETKASFDLFVDPRGARVMLDGEELGVAPLRVTNVLVGAHRLEVFGPPGYESHSREIVLGADAREVIEIALDEVAEAGEVLVEFASEPVGADVVVIADGQSMHLGPTPVTVRLNKALDYHAIFTKDGFGVETRSIDAEGDRTRVVAELDRKGGPDDEGDGEELVADVGDESEPVVEEPAAEPPTLARTLSRAERERAEERRREREDARSSRSSRRAKRRARARARRSRARQRTSAVAARALPSHKKAGKAAPGSGTLMIGAKPPCKIYVDGKATGLVTPQRALPLAPGRHRIKLVNSEHGIESKFTVAIKAGRTTRVIRDLTERM